MRTSSDWEKVFEDQIATRQRPSILGGRDYWLDAVVEYRAFGLDDIRRVRVTEIEACGRNRCPTFSGRLIERHGTGIKLGGAVWGYDDQITRVIHQGERPAPYYIEVIDMCRDVLDEHGEAWMALDEGPFYSARDAFDYGRCEVGIEWRVVKRIADSVYVGITECAGDEHEREVVDGEW